MDETIQKVRDFHGHLCADLTIGVRAAQIALREIGPHSLQRAQPVHPML